MSNIRKQIAEELSISVVIAERAYKMSIAKEDEEGVRKAAKRINIELESMAKIYKNKEKQDLLAMIALLNTNELIKNESNSEYNNKLVTRLEEIDNLLFENTSI